MKIKFVNIQTLCVQGLGVEAINASILSFWQNMELMHVAEMFRLSNYTICAKFESFLPSHAIAWDGDAVA